jgi:chemotaxis protein methyltransferase CheR
VFANHNLVTDGVFGEMNLILCRNVLIYFTKDLQNRVLKLFYDSLWHHGLLCLDSKESLRFSAYADYSEDIVKDEKIYRKKG